MKSGLFSGWIPFREFFRAHFLLAQKTELSGVPYALHSYTSFWNGYAAPPISCAFLHCNTNAAIFKMCTFFLKKIVI